MNPRLDVSLEALRRKRGSKWTSFDEQVVPAWVADMDFPIAPAIRDAIQGVLEREDVGYPGAGTLLELRSAFASRMRDRFGWDPDPGLVLPTGDLIQAMIASVATFCPGGEGVVMQTPIYYPFLQIVAVLGRRLVDNPLVQGPERYVMDLDQLRATIDDRTRLILFCNPHNPTGRVFERAELEGLAELAIEHDLVVVSDEVHSDLIFEGRKHIPFASLGKEVASRTITLTSATKAFNIAGLKCAVIHFGSEELMARQTAVFHQYLLGVPNILGIEATLAAWREGEEWLAAVVAQLDSNRMLLAELLAKRLPGVVYQPPEASFLAWLDCRALNLPSRPYDFFLSEARVAMNDGRTFSDRCDAFVRMNFATPPEILREIVGRMSDAVEKVSGLDSAP